LTEHGRGRLADSTRKHFRADGGGRSGAGATRPESAPRAWLAQAARSVAAAVSTAFGAWVIAASPGCNGITGVGDLSFDGASAAAGGSGAAGGGGASCVASTSFDSLYPGCKDCAQERCCAQINACDANTACRDCMVNGVGCSPSPPGLAALQSCLSSECTVCVPGDACAENSNDKKACATCCEMVGGGSTDYIEDLRQCTCRTDECGGNCACNDLVNPTELCKRCLNTSCKYPRCRGKSTACGFYLKCIDGCFDLP
jgi:hypothetical protein